MSSLRCQEKVSHNLIFNLDVILMYIHAMDKLLLGGLRVTNPPIRLMCPTSVRLSTFFFPDSNSKTVCPIEFKHDREIDHHHS